MTTVLTAPPDAEEARTETEASPRAGDANTPRLDLVSPLPPVRSGISDYTADLLPHLEALADVRLVRLPDQPVEEGVRQRYPLVEAERLGEEGRVPLYQMGNNLYHEEILELAPRHPGVLTLHDLVLHHLLLARTVGRGDDAETYADRLAVDHGWIGRAAAGPVRWKGFAVASQFALPAHRKLLRSQRGIVVHSRWAAAQITAEDPQILVRVVPMGVPLPERPSADAGRAFRHRLGIPDGAPVLGSLGFQTPMKRTDQVIRALTEPELSAAHLIVAGEVAEIFELEAMVRRMEIEERVHITSFLPYDEFEAAMAACDLCLNLRYPSAGETSASLLRVLAAGRPVVVSDYAQFAELPDEVVVKLGLGRTELEEMVHTVSGLLAARERRRELAEAARQYVRREHDPADAARLLIEACRSLAAQDPPGAAAPAVRPPTSLTWSSFEGRLEVAGADLPWRVGEARRLTLRLTNASEARWLATLVGPGGVSIRLLFWDREQRRIEGHRWLRLHRDLPSGESATLEARIRRPPGAAALVVEPWVSGNDGFYALGGPTRAVSLEGST